MSAKNELQNNLHQPIELVEMDERERMVVQLFRQLDEISQRDIVRFIKVLLKNK